MALISSAVRQQVFDRAKECCKYCKTQRILIGMPLVIDHILPRSIGGSDELDNLAAACYRCNLFKSDRTSAIDPSSGDRVTLFNPRKHLWTEHFTWTEKGLYIAVAI